MRTPVRENERLRAVALHTSDESFDIQELIDEHGDLFDRATGAICREAWAFGAVPLIVVSGALSAEASLVDASAEKTFGDPVGGALVVLAARMGLLPDMLCPQFLRMSATVHTRADGTARSLFAFRTDESLIAKSVVERTGCLDAGNWNIISGAPVPVLDKCDSVYRMGCSQVMDHTVREQISSLAESLVRTGHRIVALAGHVDESESDPVTSSAKGILWYGMISVTPAILPESLLPSRGIMDRITRTIRAITRTDTPRIRGN